MAVSHIRYHESGEHGDVLDRSERQTRAHTLQRRLGSHAANSGVGQALARSVLPDHKRFSHAHRSRVAHVRSQVRSTKRPRGQLQRRQRTMSRFPTMARLCLPSDATISVGFSIQRDISGNLFYVSHLFSSEKTSRIIKNLKILIPYFVEKINF